MDLARRTGPVVIDAGRRPWRPAELFAFLARRLETKREATDLNGIPVRQVSFGCAASIDQDVLPAGRRGYKPESRR